MYVNCEVQMRYNLTLNTPLIFQVESATFGSITIRYIDEVETVDENGVAVLSGQRSQTAPHNIANTSSQNITNTSSQEEESFPGF